MPEQRFLRENGDPIEWLRPTDGDSVVVQPDITGACIFMLAVIDRDFEALGTLLAARPALPLLGGFAAMAHEFGEKLYGQKLRLILDQIALEPDFDPVGAEVTPDDR